MRPAHQTMEEKPLPRVEGSDEPVLLSGSARASRLATAGYVFVSLGHIWLLRQHAATASAAGRFLFSLAVVEAALAYEGAVYALGALGRSCNLSVLTFVGRVRLLGAAMAWPWLLPWAAELNCRSGAVSIGTGVALLHQTTFVAVLISGFFILREVSFLFKGEPASALGAGEAQIGDCLPSQAVLGGHFRMDKADLEETGRAVFVPARSRSGLYVGSGLALLGHLIMGIVQGHTNAAPPWLLLGALCGLGGRVFGDVRKFKGDRKEGVGIDALLLWRREGPRLICRLGELFWIGCCVFELQRAEESPAWLASCE